MRRAPKKVPVQAELPATQSKSSAPKGIPLSKLVELIDKGLDDPQIAKVLGCSKQAVQQRRQRLDIAGLKEYKDNKTLHMTHLQQRLVNTLTDDDISKMSPYQRILTSAIVEDKFMPKQQQAATNVLQINVIVDEIDKRIRKQDTQDVVIDANVKDDND